MSTRSDRRRPELLGRETREKACLGKALALYINHTLFHVEERLWLSLLASLSLLLTLENTIHLSLLPTSPVSTPNPETYLHRLCLLLQGILWYPLGKFSYLCERSLTRRQLKYMRQG